MERAKKEKLKEEERRKKEEKRKMELEKQQTVEEKVHTCISHHFILLRDSTHICSIHLHGPYSFKLEVLTSSFVECQTKLCLTPYVPPSPNN